MSLRTTPARTILSKKLATRASFIAPMPSVQGVAGIDDAIFLHPGDGIGQQFLGHFGIELLDQGVAGPVVAVEIGVPADIEASTKRCTRSDPVYQVARVSIRVE